MAIESGAQQGIFGQRHSPQGDILVLCPDLIGGGLQLRGSLIDMAACHKI